MIRNNEHLQPGCPWYEISEIRLPNLKWCEENLCSWVVNPANTWSNLIYFLAGFLILSWSKRHFKSVRNEARLMGVSMIIMGACSFLYHQSYAFLTQVFDFLGMFVFLFLLFFYNLRRIGFSFVQNQNRFKQAWLGTVGVATLAIIGLDLIDVPIQPTIMLLAITLLSQEVWIYQKHHSKIGSLLLGFVFLVAAAICSALDLRRIWCDPTDHLIQGHAAWHIFSALGLTLLSKHMLEDMRSRKISILT